MTYLIFFTFAAPAVLVCLLLTFLLADYRVNRRSRALDKEAEERGIALLRSWLTP
jgi:hypothetical protein